MQNADHLRDLPAPVWEKTCGFLSTEDMTELSQVGVNPLRGCEAFCRTQLLVLYVLSEEDDLSAQSPASLTPADYDHVRRLGHVYTRVKLYTDVFRLQPESYRCLQQLAGRGRVVQAVGLEVEMFQGLDFLTWTDSSRYNWAHLLQACRRVNKDMAITLKVLIHGLQTDCCIFNQLFHTTASDPRYRFTDVLLLTELYPTEEEMLLYRPDLIPSPTALLLSKFPNVRLLSLQAFSINDFVLDQLARAGTIQYIQINVDLSNRLPTFTSASAWANLVTSCPDLIVDCSFAPIASDSRFEDFLHKTFKPNTPLHILDFAVDDEGMVEEFLRWCQMFRQTLNCVRIQVCSETGLCSPHCLTVLQQFLDVNRGWLELVLSEDTGFTFYRILLLRKK